MKYLVLIQSNPATAELFAGMDDAERSSAYQAYWDVVADLEASGEYLDSKALDERGQKRVGLGPDGPIATDVPLPEVTEMISGYYLVDVESEARAVEIGARFPEAAVGGVRIARTLTADELAAFG